MPQWHHPQLKRRAARERRKRDKVFVLRNNADFLRRLLMDDVAIHAPFFVIEIFPRAGFFLMDADRNHRQRHQLRMRMHEARAGGRAVVFENQNVFETRVFRQIDDAVAERPDHVFEPFQIHIVQRLAVVGRFNDHFVRAHAVHFVVHAVGGAVERAFYLERGKFVGNDADPPALLVLLATRVVVSENFRRRFIFGARAERTGARLLRILDGFEIVGTARARWR